MQKLCCVHTTQQSSASLDYLSQAYQPISHSILNHFRWELYQINSLIVRLQANQSNQHSIQRELLMPSPEVIDLTLSDDETQPDSVR